VVAVAAALYYGPQKMLETWDKYCDRFHDYKVFDIVKRSDVKHFVSRGSHYVMTWPPSASEIAQKIGRSEKSVCRSLRRLERTGKVVERSDGWHVKDDPLRD
jgi:hypothetical protein